MNDIKIVGWRLDLVRHGAWWEGNAFLWAKAELLSLISKVACAGGKLEVTIYSDDVTMNRYYYRWLQDEGISMKAVGQYLRFRVIRFYSPDVGEFKPVDF